MTFSANSITFGRARQLYGPVPSESRRIRRGYRSLVAFVKYCGKLAVARMIDFLEKLCQAVRSVLMPNDYDYAWQGDTNVYPFPSTEVCEAPLTPGQILKIAAAKKEQSTMVVEYRTAEIQPASVMPVAANGSRAWASASPTGVTTIDTKKSAEILLQARVNNSPWLGKRDAILHARA